jgi:hypothetical protein
VDPQRKPSPWPIVFISNNLVGIGCPNLQVGRDSVLHCSPPILVIRLTVQVHEPRPFWKTFGQVSRYFNKTCFGLLQIFKTSQGPWRHILESGTEAGRMCGAMTARQLCLYTRHAGHDSTTTRSRQHLYTMQCVPLIIAKLALFSGQAMRALLPCGAAILASVSQSQSWH